MKFALTTIGDIKLDVFIDLGDKAQAFCTKDRESCTLSLKYGEKIPIDATRVMMAGSAPNMAIGARRLGLKTSIVSVVGTDPTARIAFETLSQERVDTSNVKQTPGSTSFSAVLNYRGESTLLASHISHSYDLPKALSTKWVFVSELGPTYKTLFREISRRATTGDFFLACNPGAIQLEERDKSLYQLIRASQLLIVNKREAQNILESQSRSIPILLSRLQALGPKIVVITDGQKGAWAQDEERHYEAPMFHGKRVEATGAGDAFATGVISAIASGKSLEEALGWGAVNSASVVQFVGPQKGLLKKTELLKTLGSHKSYRVLSTPLITK